jgi:uncharacterized protein YndB with AHSA1/START domain
MKDTGKLTVVAHSDREIVMTREFNAPGRLVFEALTKSELVKRWLGVFGGWELVVCEIDLKVGGAYRYVWKNSSDGREMGMRGVYKEIVPGERIVNTEVFDEAWYPGEAVVTSDLTERGGRTTLTVKIIYGTQEARDGVLKSGMARGVGASYDKLAEIVEKR